MKRVTGASFPSSLVQIIELTGQACLGPGAAKMPTVLSVLLAAKEPADQAPGGALPGPPHPEQLPAWPSSALVLGVPGCSPHPTPRGPPPFASRAARMCPQSPPYCGRGWGGGEVAAAGSGLAPGSPQRGQLRCFQYGNFFPL